MEWSRGACIPRVYMAVRMSLATDALPQLKRSRLDSAEPTCARGVNQHHARGQLARQPDLSCKVKKQVRHFRETAWIVASSGPLLTVCLSGYISLFYSGYGSNNGCAGAQPPNTPDQRFMDGGTPGTP